MPVTIGESGKRVGVILDIRAYERLLEALEDLEDLRAADETLAAIGRGERAQSARPVSSWPTRQRRRRQP